MKGKTAKNVAEGAGTGEPEVPARKVRKLKKARSVAEEKSVMEEAVEEQPADLLPVRKIKKKKKLAQSGKQGAVVAEEQEQAVKPKKRKVTQVPASEDGAARAANEKEIPTIKAKKKKARKVVVKDESEDESESVDQPASAKKGNIANDEQAAEEADIGEKLEVFVGGIPWSVEKETVERDFSECGEIERLQMPLNDEGKPRGIAFITFKTKEAVQAALKYDGEDYAGRTLKVNLAGDKGKGKSDKGKGDKGKGKGDKGKGKNSNETTACVRGLPWSIGEETLRSDFSDCGEIEVIRMLLNDEGKSKGIAFIQFKTKDGLEKAKEYNETDYGGRTIYVDQAGQGGKGKSGKGDDGKGKKGGKDGKSKGKDGKGKGKKGKSKDSSEHSGKGRKTFDDDFDE